MRVDPTGTILVTAPHYVPTIMINRFVEKSRPWIERQQRRIKLRQDTFPVFDWNKQIVGYLGTLFDLRFNFQDSRIKIDQNIINYYPITGNINDGKKLIIGWLKREAEKFITQRTLYWTEKMGVKFRQIKFRQQRSRWGSCSSAGTITYNWRLIHFLPQVIDYVVIHELAHIRHHDHSERFWRLVEAYMPTYKQHVRFLKKQVLDLI